MPAHPGVVGRNSGEMHRQGGLYVFYKRHQHGGGSVDFLDADSGDSGASRSKGAEDHSVLHVWHWGGDVCD